jgi:hypothetical protein
MSKSRDKIRRLGPVLVNVALAGLVVMVALGL